jgi:hypothetical protein
MARVKNPSKKVFRRHSQFSRQDESAARPLKPGASALVLRRPAMARETQVLDKHSHSTIFSQNPRWGTDMELCWRSKRVNSQLSQHRSMAQNSFNVDTRRRDAADSEGSRPSSVLSSFGSRQHRSVSHSTSFPAAEEPGAVSDDYFSMLSKAGAHRLSKDEKLKRQVDNVLRVLRAAVGNKRELYGNSVY